LTTLSCQLNLEILSIIFKPVKRKKKEWEGEVIDFSEYKLANEGKVIIRTKLTIYFVPHQV